MTAVTEQAVTNVLGLHQRCSCNACLATIRPACTGCTEHFPCPTIRAIRTAHAQVHTEDPVLAHARALIAALKASIGRANRLHAQMTARQEHTP